MNGVPTRGGYALPDENDFVNWGVSGKLNWDLGDNMNLTAVLSTRTIDEIHTFDTDGMPIVVEHVINDIVNKYTHAEVRLSGTSDFIDWVGGVFYFDAEGVQHASLIQASSGGQRKLFTTYEPKSQAVFANATLRPFGDTHRHRARRALFRRQEGRQLLEPRRHHALVVRHPLPRDPGAAEGSSWKAGVNYRADGRDAALCLRGHGQLAAGLQPAAAAALAGGAVRRQREHCLRTRRASSICSIGKLRLNAAAFYTDFKNRPSTIGGAEALLSQTSTPVPGNQVLIPLPGGPPGSTQCRATVQTPAEAAAGAGITCLGRTYYRNLPASVRGVELEYSINPIDNLLINGSVGWSKFWSPDIAARTVNRRQGNPFGRRTRVCSTAFQAPGLGGAITPRFDWTYEGSQVVSGTSTKYNYLMPKRSLFNGRVSYENEANEYTVSAGVVNLFDKFYYRNVFDYQGLGYPQTDAQPAPPREWYLTISKRF